VHIPQTVPLHCLLAVSAGVLPKFKTYASLQDYGRGCKAHPSGSVSLTVSEASHSVSCPDVRHELICRTAAAFTPHCLR